MQKPIFIFILLFVVRLLMSCGEPCGASGGGYRVVNFHPSLLTKNESGLLVTIEETEAVHHDNLFVEFFIETVSKKNFVAPVGSLSSANACSIYIQLLDEIASVKIKSDAEFQNRQSGEDLADFFGWSQYGGNEWASISDMSLQWIEFQFYLKLMNAPLEAATHQFTISFELEDGRSFDVVLDPIEILPKTFSKTPHRFFLGS